MILIPFLFFKSDESIALDFLMACGAAIIFYNAITRFEYSIYKFISIKLNRKLDMLVAIVLLGSAWIEISRGQFAELNLAFGLIQVCMIAFSANHRHYQNYNYKKDLN